MKSLAALGLLWLSAWAVLSLREPDGVAVTLWGIVGGLLSAGGVLIWVRVSIGSRVLISFLALSFVGLLGFLGASAGTLVHFRWKRAYYVAEAAKAAKRCVREKAPCSTIAVPDQRSAGFVFIHDPLRLGPDAWRVHAEMPASCERVDVEWVHCVVS